MSLTRDQILQAATPVKVEERDIPALGGLVRFRALRAGERIDWETAYAGGGSVNMREYILGLVSRSIVDDNDKPMFTVLEVAEFSREAYVAASEAAAEINGIGAKAVADSEGKSEGTAVSDGAGI